MSLKRILGIKTPKAPKPPPVPEAPAAPPTLANASVAEARSSRRRNRINIRRQTVLTDDPGSATTTGLKTLLGS